MGENRSSPHIIRNIGIIWLNLVYLLITIYFCIDFKGVLDFEMKGKARTHPNLLRVVLGPCVQCCPCEASEPKINILNKGDKALILSPFDLSRKKQAI